MITPLSLVQADERAIKAVLQQHYEMFGPLNPFPVAPTHLERSALERNLADLRRQHPYAALALHNAVLLDGIGGEGGIPSHE